jgi:hypothetical protein
LGRRREGPASQAKRLALPLAEGSSFFPTLLTKGTSGTRGEKGRGAGPTRWSEALPFLFPEGKKQPFGNGGE